ncbi:MULTISPECIES: sacsin N-terminal ATP-binding-like domain-containing protein [unclassified Gordonia (in: high G+C Gram-positive bacteria)]|uniref:sacsin N-terminal ATP-binding-like domain-containing protein n=1 Tax=unclassified Gordonia (in: high G+C Gram-positive bacteria) TaxID=2657482 RepID=UPI00196352E4|nr:MULTISPECIES: hypothetical protein [unclassified Gordonia (in: high G+C Gram-positive bacteria)]MBN0974579.1 hypothetical protein [Gordonia sp. BP-119]MBN0984379.1 hypothetical protein [Gordonia sp. BP-94]
MTGEIWWFEAVEATEAAREVVHHDPDSDWERIPIPADASAASASLSALANEYQKLPPSIRGALGRATENAAQLSDDRLQGLAELLQNADDEGADTACFLVAGDRLMFGHNGNDFTLPDVWGLTIPWLSEKTSQAEKLGRFGIGLKTLQSLSETLEGHNGHFHLSLGRSALQTADADPRWPNKPDDATTVFVVPFQHGATTELEVSDWLNAWGDAGLLFLRSLRSVTLLDVEGHLVTRLRVTADELEPVEFAGREALRTMVTAEDGRTWLRYSRNTKSPTGHRAGKSHHNTTPVAIAFPRFDGDTGHVHIGLPVRSIGLPFRFSAQFDPLANRRDLADSQWNIDLLGLVADLWLDAALDAFHIEPAGAWADVPLLHDYTADRFAASALDESLLDRLLTAARLAFSKGLRLEGRDGDEHPLRDLAYETPDLTDILTEDDIRDLANAADVVAARNRSDNDRWRAVIADLKDLGGETPALVDVHSAAQLLTVDGRTIEFVADLTAAVIAVATNTDEEDADLSSELYASTCVVLDDGRRTSPEAATGLDVLLPREASQLWSSLGIGAHIHPTYSDRPTWSVIAQWLHDSNALRQTATDEDALRVLAEAGRMDVELPEPLTDDQANAIRAALEPVDDSVRTQLAAGIGHAIRLEATVYDANGNRTQVYARPAEAYFIEKERNSWSNAAKRTPGLVWLHRRYSEALRAPTGRAGIGAQRFFRLLGAENLPRLTLFPDDAAHYKQFAYHGSGLWWYAPGSPSRRVRQMNEVGAQCTRDDHAAPDLKKVLADITAEKNGKQRRKRANALIGCLARNWDRLEPHARVIAANPYNGWDNKGEVDSWWISTAASIPWLSNGRGRPTAPGELRIRTPTNEAMHGTDPALYLAESYDVAGHREVLSALGVEGNPTVAALIRRIEQIRTLHQSGRPASPNGQGGHPMTAQEAADLAAPFYQALAAEVHGGIAQRVGNMQLSVLRNHFDRGDGLIVTNHGWRRTALARSGPPIFGDLFAFVPAVSGAERLWTALRVPAPTADDAKSVIKKLATRSLSTDEQQIMLEALRILARTPPERLGQLRRQPVYIGSGWSRRRPVYAVENPLLADGLKTKVAIWQPGGQLTQLKSLIDPLALTSIDEAHAHVLHESSAIYDADLTDLFRRATQNLQTDLTQSAPASAEAIRLTWEELCRFQVAVLPNLQVQVTLPDGSGHRVALTAWLDSNRSTLFVHSAEETSRARSGGYAIASSFETNPREIAHAWLAAWADAEAGAQAELVVSAAAREAEDKLRREKSHAALNLLPTSKQPVARPARKRQKRTTGQGTADNAPPRPKARTLVDPNYLVLRDATGELIVNAPRDEGDTDRSGATGRHAAGEPTLKDPKRDHPKKPGGGGRGPLNYTAQEREDAGLELLRLVLASDDCELTDVRHQPKVGADAVDDQDRYYELKVHQGAIPDTVKLEDSQIQRAMAAPDDFFLVLVGNIEDGHGSPEVRIIHDPLHHLTVQPQGAVVVPHRVV